MTTSFLLRMKTRLFGDDNQFFVKDENQAVWG